MGKIERKNFFWGGCGQERVIGKEKLERGESRTGRER